MDVSKNRWRKKIKALSQRSLALLPLSLIKKTSRHIPIGIFYHIVSDWYVPHISNIFSYRDTGKFEKDIVFLKKNFNLLTYKELLSCLRGEKHFPDYPAFISFDDGLRETFVHARPILKKYNIPCIFFITTDSLDNKDMFFRHKISLCIDRLKKCSEETLNKVFDLIKQELKIVVKTKHGVETVLKTCGSNCLEVLDAIGQTLEIDFSNYLRSVRPYLTSQEISIMLSEGFDIGSHGKTHNFLGKVSYEELTQEINESSFFLNKRFGIDKMGFSFPFSARGINLNWLESISSASKYIELFFDSSGIGFEGSFLVNRIGCDFSSVKDARDIDLCNIIKFYSIKNELFNRHV